MWVFVAMFFCFYSTVFSGSSEMEDAGKRGKVMGVEYSKNATVDPKAFQCELSPQEGHFNAGETKQEVLSGKASSGELADFLMSDELRKNTENKMFTNEEFFIRRSETVANNPLSNIAYSEKEGGNSYQIATCKESGEPYISYLDRVLQVTKVVDKEITKINICKGHVETFCIRNVANGKKKLNNKFSKDPTLQQFILVPGPNKDYVDMKYTHKNDTATCSNPGVEEVVVKVSIIENEAWVFDDLKGTNVSESNFCNYLRTDCIDASEKLIDGVAVSRPCWKERLFFECTYPKYNDCEFLKSKDCELISRACIDRTDRGCALWENTYKCFSLGSGKSTNLDGSTIYCIDGDCNEFKMEENQSFVDVAAQMVVFSQMKDELEQGRSLDARTIRFFSGHKFSCKRDTLGNIISDCCFSNSGLAMQMGLANGCSAEELSLGEKREKGQCHFVGNFSKKTLGITTFKGKRFCCFPSKISRIFQEQARKQLKIGWGSGNSPNCKGLSQDQIVSLDFSKMDFSEFAKDFEKTPLDMNTKIESLNSRMESIRERLENQELKAS